MSGRPSRQRKTCIASLTESQRLGLVALIEDNSDDIMTMLDLSSTGDVSDQATMLTKLQEVMGVNCLGCEALLGRFFSEEMLRSYCLTRMGVSGKGTVPVLAARIAKAWQKPSFKPQPCARTIASTVEPALQEHASSHEASIRPARTSKRVLSKDERDGDTDAKRHAVEAPDIKPSLEARTNL
eukprot:32725-Chlamydomonas_euryale.AAC.18